MFELIEVAPHAVVRREFDFRNLHAPYEVIIGGEKVATIADRDAAIARAEKLAEQP